MSYQENAKDPFLETLQLELSHLNNQMKNGRNNNKVLDSMKDALSSIDDKIESLSKHSGSNSNTNAPNYSNTNYSNNASTRDYSEHGSLYVNNQKITNFTQPLHISNYDTIDPNGSFAPQPSNHIPTPHREFNEQFESFPDIESNVDRILSEDEKLRFLSLQLSNTEQQLRTLGNMLLEKREKTQNSYLDSNQKHYFSFSPRKMFNEGEDSNSNIKASQRKKSSSQYSQPPDSPNGNVNSKRSAKQFMDYISTNPDYKSIVESSQNYIRNSPNSPRNSNGLSKIQTPKKNSTEIKATNSNKLAKYSNSPISPRIVSKNKISSPRQLNGNRSSIHNSRIQSPIQDSHRFKTPEETPGPGHFDTSKSFSFLEKHHTSAVFGTKRRLTGPTPNLEHTVGPGQYTPNRNLLSTERNSFRATIGNDKSKIWWQ